MARFLVAIARGGDDKFQLLEEAAEKAGFWPNIEAAFRASSKTRDRFSIAIKPNLMILLTAKVPVIATDPQLVEHLVRLLRARGFTSIKVVEAQNTMGNWVRNRTVANVARVAGYSGEGYEIVDLTLEMEPHTFRVKGMPDWKNFVGRTWRDADYRIDFAKFKSQPDNGYTLNLKNEFGTLPLQNKYMEYHTRLPYWACTMYTLDNFRVHFAFIDAYTGSDGAAGFAVQYNPKLLKIVAASNDILALDIAGARLMGQDPWESPLARFVMMNWGEPEIETLGDATPIADWEPVPEEIHNLVDIGQCIYVFSNIGAAAGIIELDTKEFPPRLGVMRIYYYVMNWIFLMLSGRKRPKHHREFFHNTVRRQKVAQQAKSAAGLARAEPSARRQP